MLSELNMNGPSPKIIAAALVGFLRTPSSGMRFDPESRGPLRESWLWD